MEPRCPKCFTTPCICRPVIEVEQKVYFSRPESAPATVTSIGAARFNKDTASPKDCNPRDALEAALAYLDHVDDKPDHIIVLFGRTSEGGGSATKWFQAGSYEYHAQIGLLYEGGQMIRENG